MSKFSCKEGLTEVDGRPAKTVNLYLCGYRERIDREITKYVNETCERHQYGLKKIVMSQRMHDDLEKQGWTFQGHYIYINQYGANYRTYKPYVQHFPIIIDNARDDTADEAKITMVR